MATPSVVVLRTPGTNCDGETAFAFERAGARVERIHVNRLREAPRQLAKSQILALPGGFSYGDDVAAGKILAAQLRHFLNDTLRKFRDGDRLILGVCNGFQVLLKAGLLLPPDEDGPTATLGHNASRRFTDRWVRLAVTPGNCPFLTGIDSMHVPVAHGEGRFECREGWYCKGLAESGQVVMRYSGVNPNGSQENVAGVCDASGRVLGLMPHPERHVLPTQNPHWTRDGLKAEGDGMQLFRNAVEFFKKT